MSALDRIVADVRRRAELRRAKQPLARLKDVVREDSWRRERFLTALARDPFALVPVLRRRTPWSGALLEDPGARPTRVPVPGPRWFAFAQGCLDGGAAALAVTTELDHFGGSLDDLRAVEFTKLPRVRDDFVVDEAMLWETCLYGADAAVLRAAALDDAELAHLRAVAKELGLAVLVAAASERDLDRALAQEPEVLLVAARDEQRGEVNLARAERLLARAPAAQKRAIGGGLARADDLRHARDAGASVALVGEALLRAPDARATLEGWRAAIAANGV